MKMCVCVYVFVYMKTLVYLQDKKRIYVGLFDENKREKDKQNVKIMILGLIISTSISIIQWNISKHFTLHEHHLWWGRHWQNISSEEKTAKSCWKSDFRSQNKLMTTVWCRTEELLGRNKFTWWQGLLPCMYLERSRQKGQHSSRVKTIWKTKSTPVPLF